MKTQMILFYKSEIFILGSTFWVNTLYLRDESFLTITVIIEILVSKAKNQNSSKNKENVSKILFLLKIDIIV